MKTYILRTPKAVEPQNRKRKPLSPSHPPDPAITATVAVICGLATPTPPPVLRPRVLYVGLDVQNATIAVSLAPSDSPAVRRYGIIVGQHEDGLRLLKKLQATHPGAGLKFCCEPGPRGYPLCRFIRQPVDRVKTDRRAADKMARPGGNGKLAVVAVLIVKWRMVRLD